MPAAPVRERNRLPNGGQNGVRLAIRSGMLKGETVGESAIGRNEPERPLQGHVDDDPGRRAANQRDAYTEAFSNIPQTIEGRSITQPELSKTIGH